MGGSRIRRTGSGLSYFPELVDMSDPTQAWRSRSSEHETRSPSVRYPRAPAPPVFLARYSGRLLGWTSEQN